MGTAGPAGGTERLYYADSHLFAFDAVLLSCKSSGTRKGCYEIVLDRTAFFPEGGGQNADTGRIGEARVTDVQEQDGVLVHYTDTLPSAGIGDTVSCALDAEQRLRRMQNHSGEHIVSGLVHSAFGCENVGFHMSGGSMTVDFSGELTPEQLTEIEQKSNEAVRANLPVKAFFPEPDTLQALEYRSKLELTENVRIVEIDGIDRCACCAPHVSRTGEIGLIKILGGERHRGGMRIELICGMDALEDYRRRQDSAAAISGLLSAKRDEIAPAVERLMAERDQLKYLCAGLESELVQLLADSYPATPEDPIGNIAVFRNFSEPAARELVNRLMEKCAGAAAVFFAVSGANEKGVSAPSGEKTPFRYIIGSRSIDLRAKAKEINSAIGGRGGGRPEMISGTASADKESIRAYFEQTRLLP